MYRRFLRKPAYHTIVSQKYHQLHPTRWCPPSYVNVSLENPHEYYSNITPIHQPKRYNTYVHQLNAFTTWGTTLHHISIMCFLAYQCLLLQK